MPQGQKPLCHVHFWRVPFSHFLPLLLPSLCSLQYKEMVYYGRLGEKVEMFCSKSVWRATNGPIWMPQVHKLLCLILGEFPFPFSAPGSFLPFALCSIKKWFIMGGGWVKRWGKIGTKSVKRAANGPVWMSYTPWCHGLWGLFYWRFFSVSYVTSLRRVTRVTGSSSWRWF